MVTGGCYCGSVQYQVDGPVRQVIACHCTQCQKISGSFVMASSAANKDLTVEDADKTLSWFQSSDFAERGFCSRCGSQLFWRTINGDETSIMAGSIHQNNKLNVAGHIYVEDKADYYRIPSEDTIIEGNHEEAPSVNI